VQQNLFSISTFATKFSALQRNHNLDFDFHFFFELTISYF
jgi:hypothetical protein